MLVSEANMLERRGGEFHLSLIKKDFFVAFFFSYKSTLSEIAKIHAKRRLDKMC